MTDSESDIEKLSYSNIKKEERDYPVGEWRNRTFQRKAINRYWNGFDDYGNEVWCVQLNDGSIVTNKHREYGYWSRKFFPRRY